MSTSDHSIIDRVNLGQQPSVQARADDRSNTISYLVTDPATKSCAIIDPVLDFEHASGRISFTQANALIAIIKDRELKLEWIIETHVHADHLSSAPYIQEQVGGRIGIGAAITVVQDTFGIIFNEGTQFARDGSQFDYLFEDGDEYTIGNLTGIALSTPGHTPACMSHVIGNACFVGDTMFMPDSGSARADFPGGDAGDLYDSIQRLLSLPDQMRLFMCHDYGPNGRDLAWETTVAEQRARNIHVGKDTGHGIDRDAYIALRTQRDATLAVPELILPSLQVNMRAGQVPVDRDGKPMLKLPINALLND